jgi:hypothetical protein
MASSSFIRRSAVAFVISSFAVQGAWAAESTTKAAPSASSNRPAASRAPTGKGPLPDPSLLDGSTQPAEKKSETGMIGDFELPGDENVRNGKVGGKQGGQQGGQQNPGLQVDVPIPGIPSLGGSQGSQSSAGGQPPGLPQLPKAGGQSGQSGGQQTAGQMPGQAGGAQGGDPSSSPLGGAGDPNAKAEGVQVGQLGGEGSSQDSVAAGEKPPPMAIGDSAMKIQTSGAAAGVVGAQQVGVNTQQHEKGTGSGGKGTGGSSGGANRAEKGRTMPAGL